MCVPGIDRDSSHPIFFRYVRLLKGQMMRGGCEKTSERVVG